MREDPNEMESGLELLIDQLEQEHCLPEEAYRKLVAGYTPSLAEYAAGKAAALRKSIYGNRVYVRGLIEISNYCKNDCLYCGIRRSNRDCDRYRLTKEDILLCCEEGYGLGMRTFVLQGGEDGYFTDERLVDIVSSIRRQYPDCAITLSLGERSRESYEALYQAGANRYLLRHETADQEHYGRLHPVEMSFSQRMRCLKDLREIGFQTGCGWMVGSPGQTADTLARDLKFVEQLQPHMCGIGPFIPHRATPFAQEPAGSVALTCFLLSLVRLIRPQILLPATTALGTIDPYGREKGLAAGGNVVMPNLSPLAVRKKYELYNDKISTGEESAQCVEALRKRMAACGYEVVTDRGDMAGLRAETP